MTSISSVVVAANQNAVRYMSGKAALQPETDMAAELCKGHAAAQRIANELDQAKVWPSAQHHSLRPTHIPRRAI